MTPKRKGKVAVYSYYDGLKKTTKSTDADLDWSIADYVDNTNLTLYGGMSNLCRYILELRIWNKELSPAEVKQYSNKLKLSPLSPISYLPPFFHTKFSIGQVHGNDFF